MIEIDLNESNASKRVIPIWCVQSNGTTPAALESGGSAQLMFGGAYLGATAANLSAWSAAAGEYYVLLGTSEVSAEGIGAVRYSSGTALETSTEFRVRINHSNISQVDGSRAHGLRLASHLSSIVTFKVVAGVLTSTQFTTDVPTTTSDFYNGRVMVFGSGALAGQATSINTSGGYIGFSNSSSKFNVAAMTGAPSANDVGVIV